MEPSLPLLSVLDYYGEALRNYFDMLVEEGFSGAALLLTVDFAVLYGMVVFIQAFTMWMLSEYLGVRGEEFWRSVLAALALDLSTIVVAALTPGEASPLLGVAGGLALGSLAASRLYRTGVARSLALCLAGLVVVLILPAFARYAEHLPRVYWRPGP